MTGHDKEALRQQMLVRALWHDARSAVVGGWLRDSPQRLQRGLQAYQANAGALAERALAAAFPTVAQIVGEESFAALARAFWHHQPPLGGDIAEWGDGLAAFIAADEQLASEPYLADVARLDWVVHQADRASDDDGEPTGLDALASTEPARLWLVFRAGTTLLQSKHPVVTIRQAHRSDAADRFAAVRAAFAAGGGEAALVVRQRWRVEVEALAHDDAVFTAALLGGESLGAALDRAGAAFDFESWLIECLRRRRLSAVRSDR